MPVPSAVISVAISPDDSILSKRARSTLRILPRKRKNGLIQAVASLLGGSTCRVTFDQKQFRLRGIALLAVRQLARKRRHVECTLASRQFTRLARSFARRCRFHDLADNGLGFLGRSSSQICNCSFTTPSTIGRTSEETSLSLVCEENFGSGTFTESTQVSPSRQSSRKGNFLLLGNAGLHWRS
jgi:hypothetical protein